MNEVKSKTKRRVGCLLLSLTSIALLLLVYQLAYYNPMRLTDRQHLEDALSRGLVAECDAFLASTNTAHYRPARNQWPSAIRTLHPRSVDVHPRKPKVVGIALWKNYREWERNSILGVWTEHGGCSISLIVYATHPDEDQLVRDNSNPLVPYFTRKVADRVYLRYPQKMWDRHLPLEHRRRHKTLMAGRLRRLSRLAA